MWRERLHLCHWLASRVKWFCLGRKYFCPQAEALLSQGGELSSHLKSFKNNSAISWRKMAVQLFVMEAVLITFRVRRRRLLKTACQGAGGVRHSYQLPCYLVMSEAFRMTCCRAVLTASHGMSQIIGGS